MSNKLGKKARRAKRNRGHGGPKFIQLFRYMLDSPAYVSLSTAGRAALIEVVRGYDGSNNGRIVLSERQLAERIGYGRKAASCALQELIDKGFIEPRVRGAFSLKFRRATEWRLNDRRCDVTGMEQSQAFLRWQNPASEARPKSKTRESKRLPYGSQKDSTGNFSEEPRRESKGLHYTNVNGSQKDSTSISTSSSELKHAAPPEHPQRVTVEQEERSPLAVGFTRGVS